MIQSHGARWFWVAVLMLAATVTSADTSWPWMVESADGTPISYQVHGSGEPTLVFIHGWSCDGRYWQEQVDHFSASHRVVVLDLAGHGHSGLGREQYTLSAFGQDVQAVVEATAVDQVVFVGHSMGGPVSAHAAALMPERAIGIVGVDTFQSVEGFGSREEVEGMLAPLRDDFRSGARNFVGSMFHPDTDARLRDWVVADMSAAPEVVAMSAMDNMMEDYLVGRTRELFDELSVPVVAINADFWPTDVETNRRYMHSFDLIVMEDADHFLHMARPDAFNRKLETVIERLAAP